MESFHTEQVVVRSQGAALHGELACPVQADGLVIFAHGSGSNRQSPRNQFVASQLREAGLASLLLDLLSPAEMESPLCCVDVDLLADRLRVAGAWAATHPLTRALPLGLFGASTGAAAALQAAASEDSRVKAVVCRGGRTDLAARDALARVHAPTLLIVGGLDTEVLQMNRAAAEALHCEHRVAVVPEASHMFAEPGALERVATHTTRWFCRHLTTTSYRPPIAEETCVE